MDHSIQKMRVNTNYYYYFSQMFIQLKCQDMESFTGSQVHVNKKKG